MQGVGDHMKAIIVRWLGVNTGGCGGCEALLKQMNDNPPEWSRQHLREILPAIERNARKSKDWKARILARIPGIRLPIVSIVFLAIARAEEDLREAEEASGDVPAA